MIFNFYYKIWVDCITKACSIPANKNSWKGFTMIFMSMAMALNFILFMAIFQRNILGKYFYHFEVDIFPGKNLDALISGFTLFILPNVLLNYFLIFRNNRYEMLLTKYKSYNGKLFISYFLASLALPLLLIVVGKLFF
jgi:hypothetical protein